MSRRLVVSALTVLTLAAPAARAQETIPAPVFVTVKEIPPPPPLTPKEHEAAINAAHERMFAVAAEMRKQHGDKVDAWPRQAEETFADARDAYTMAQARSYYRRPETSLGLDDSVTDFLRGAEKNKKMTTVASAEEASLVVQITNRRYAPGPGITDPKYFIRFRLLPGAKMTPVRFAELTRPHKWDSLWSTLFARATPASGFVDLEAGSMASYKNCAAAVRQVVENFVWQQMDPSYVKKK